VLLHALHRLRISLGPSMPMSLDVVFIGIWTVPSTVSAQLSFTSPAPLNNDAAGDTAHDIHPELACDGAGTCVTVWRRRDDLDPARADGDVLFARSSDRGHSCTSPALLDPGGSGGQWRGSGAEGGRGGPIVETSGLFRCQPTLEMSGSLQSRNVGLWGDRPSTQGGAEPRLENSAEDRSRRRSRRVCLFSNSPNPFLPSISSPRTRKRFFVPLALIRLDRGENGAKPVVGHDGSL